jgi:hypothetical protein
MATAMPKSVGAASLSVPPQFLPPHMMQPRVNGRSGTPRKISAMAKNFFECTRRFVAALASLLPSTAEAVHVAGLH